MRCLHIKRHRRAWKSASTFADFCRMCVSNCLKYCIINKNALFSPSSSYYYLVFILFSLLSYVHFLRNHFWDEHDMKSYVRISTNFIAHLSVFLSNVTIVIFMLYANFTLTCNINFMLHICNNPLVIFTFYLLQWHEYWCCCVNSIYQSNM